MHQSTTDRFLRIRNPPQNRSRRAILRRFAAAYPPLDGEGRRAERAGVGCDLGVTPTPTPPRKGISINLVWPAHRRLAPPTTIVIVPRWPGVARGSGPRESGGRARGDDSGP